MNLERQVREDLKKMNMKFMQEMKQEGKQAPPAQQTSIDTSSVQ
jgi:hypothetical protein